MKVIQLGGADDGLCHFLSFGGYEMLLDCGIKLQSLRREVTATGSSIFRFQLPALQSVDVEALDVVLLSNHLTMLALPLLTQVLGFKGQVYATQLTIDFGRVFLEELAALNQGEDSAVFAVEGVTDGMDAELPMFSLKEIETCCRKIQSVEYSEVVQLAYGVQVTALSSGFSLGASIWLIEGPNDRLAYVAAASGDYNRHPKELDLLPLVDCETLLLTDLKPDRDPHANTERMVERVLSNVNRVLERGGVCIIPTTPCGVLFDLIEAVYAACLHNKQNVPMYFISNHASRIMELTQLGAEWLCEKKIEKLYAGEDAFLHESLLKNNLFHAVPEISAATAATFQNGSVLFVGHSSLKFGHAPGLIRMLGNESHNAVLLIDPLVESTEAFAPFQDLNIEKIACPIDPRLSCGDANQFIARCCPQNLIIPHEYTVAPPTVGTEIVSSHFACVLPLHDLTAAKTKAELLTYPMKQFDPIVIEKASKYLDGRLDPKLAAQATITEIAGKAAACVNGVLNVKRKTFVLEAAAAASSTVCSSIDVSDDSKLKGSGKRKLASMTDSDVICESHSIDFKEKSSLLLGQVDEEKLMKQVKTHDPQAQVYISQGQGDADVFMSIPSLDARVTLWKETGKTLVETEKEDARALLTSFVLAQLVVIAQVFCQQPWLRSPAARMERVEDGTRMNVVPPMFHAGISNKFTKRHIANFRDTTLTAASAAKHRAELKLERQADAIEKQQQKIDNEMKKIEEITQSLHRQQLREAKRLRSHLNYAATKIQAGYRHHLHRVNEEKRAAAVGIQRVSRGFLARRLSIDLRAQLEENNRNYSSTIISGCIRVFAARKVRAKEVELRSKAVCVIQSIVRMAAARSIVRERRRQRHEAEVQHRAAIMIQCNARSFMTRLIYLDVLYLICRIQAVMRGCLVRKHQRWIRSVDMEAISKLQAHIRGYLVRKGMEEVQNDVCCDTTRSSVNSVTENEEQTRNWIMQRDLNACAHNEARIRMERAASFSFGNESKEGLKRVFGRSSTGLGWQPPVEPAIKRSYWLPAGASFDRRLPVLPVPKRMVAFDRGSGDPLSGAELRRMGHSRMPKKRPHQKPCPVRLSPMVIPAANASDASNLPLSSESEVDGDAVLADLERSRRHEELRQKMLVRKIEEKRQQVLGMRLKRETENEANERKLMEREEKSIRLQLKFLRRRSKEGKIRQMTADQRREERERLAMAREERHARIHNKVLARQLTKKRQLLATASTTTSESGSQDVSSRRGSDVRQHSSATKACKAACGSKGADSDDDGDMSFLDINFTIPSSMKSRRQRGSNSGSVKTRNGVGQGKPGKRSRPIGGKRSREGNVRKRTPVTESSQCQLSREEEDDCGYGDEFEDIVDESSLGRLIC